MCESRELLGIIGWWLRRFLRHEKQNSKLVAQSRSFHREFPSVWRCSEGVPFVQFGLSEWKAWPAPATKHRQGTIRTVDTSFQPRGRSGTTGRSFWWPCGIPKRNSCLGALGKVGVGDFFGLLLLWHCHDSNGSGFVFAFKYAQPDFVVPLLDRRGASAALSRLKSFKLIVLRSEFLREAPISTTID